MPLWVAAGVIWVAWWLLLLFMPIRLRLRARATSAGGRGWAEADVAWLLLRRRWRWSGNLDEWLLRPLARRGRDGGQRGAGAGRVVRPALAYLASRLRVRRLSLDLAVGTGDSLQTAVACGAAWSLSGVLLGALSAWVRLRPGSVHVSVMPEFGPSRLEAAARCTASLRAFYLLPAVGIMLRRGGLRLLRRRPGRRRRARRPARLETGTGSD